MGQSLFSQGKFHDAITIFNEVLNFVDNDPGVYINWGDSYRELKKFNLSLSDYHYALDLGGEKQSVSTRLALTHFALGVNLFNAKDYEGSKIEFSRSIDYCDKIPEAFSNWGWACIELNQIDLGLYDFEKTIDLDPTHAFA